MNVKSLLVPIAFFVAVMTTATGNAQAPAGSTGECKDGTYTSAEKKRGACAAHGGVKDWYEKKAAGTSAKPSAAATPAGKPAETMAAPAAAATPSKSVDKASTMPTAAAAGGGDGKVWVNTSSKVYHCSTDKWYGKTKKGEYMSEADAKAKGNHADHGKVCA